MVPTKMTSKPLRLRSFALVRAATAWDLGGPAHCFSAELQTNSDGAVAVPSRVLKCISLLARSCLKILSLILAVRNYRLN